MKINTLQGKKIFIAGSTGMVGSAIYRKFKEYEIKNNLDKLTYLTPSRAELNLEDHTKVKEWFHIFKPEIVILAAAKVGGILANNNNPADFILKNLKIQTNTIEAAWKNGVEKFIFLGSSCIYPKFAEQPLKEESLLNGELEKTNQWYAISKITGIKLCEALKLEHGFDSLSLMPTNLYGPKDNYHPLNSHVMASLIRKFCIAKSSNQPDVVCWGSGRPLREFMHVDDLANAIIYILENWDLKSKYLDLKKNGQMLNYINIGTGQEISIKDLSLKIANLVGYKGKIKWDHTKPDGTPRKLLNSERIRNLGWEPEIKLSEGIEMTVNDFMKNNIKV